MSTDTPTVVGGIIDPYPRQETTTLIKIADRITPRRDVDKWVATMDNRTWRIRDGYAEAYDGTRDPNTGASVVVERIPVDDFRAMLIEHLESYGVTNYQINQMRS